MSKRAIHRKFESGFQRVEKWMTTMTRQVVLRVPDDQRPVLSGKPESCWIDQSEANDGA